MAGETEWPQFFHIGPYLVVVSSGESYSDNSVSVYDPATDEVERVHLSNPYDVLSLLDVLVKVFGKKEVPDAQA